MKFSDLIEEHAIWKAEVLADETVLGFTDWLEHVEPSDQPTAEERRHAASHRKVFSDLTAAEQQVVDLGASIIEQMPGLAVTFEEDETEQHPFDPNWKSERSALAKATRDLEPGDGYGYGPAGLQTKEGAERAQAEYQIAQNTLALQVAHCRYCKAAKTRAANRLAELQKHDPEDINYVVRPGQGYTFGHLVEQQKHKVAEARCKEHAQRARLNYVCSPVSETYWCS